MRGVSGRAFGGTVQSNKGEKMATGKHNLHPRHSAKPKNVNEPSKRAKRFTVETELVGSGGMGKIKKGFDHVLNRDIAIKILDPLWKTANAADRERFRKEARILAGLRHPSIPSVYDVSFPETDGRCPGGS